MKKNKTVFGTIQVDMNVKEQMVDYCNRHDLKIGRFIQRLFLHHVSGAHDAATVVPKQKTLLCDNDTTVVLKSKHSLVEKDTQ